VSSQSIPPEVREQVKTLVSRFNRENFACGEQSYVPRFSGKYVYLDRSDFGSVGPVCRLEYTGDARRWRFAMYHYCSDQYGPAQASFPGARFLDGTVEGAMKAAAEPFDS
jgi:hypothetical protein